MQEGNTAHAEDCKYHTDQLNAGPQSVIVTPGNCGNEVDDDNESVEESDSSDESEVETVAEQWERRAQAMMNVRKR
jgi:hypothetical protein